VTQTLQGRGISTPLSPRGVEYRLSHSHVTVNAKAIMVSLDATEVCVNQVASSSTVIKIRRVYRVAVLQEQVLRWSFSLAICYSGYTTHLFPLAAYYILVCNLSKVNGVIDRSGIATRRASASAPVPPGCRA
jgi:hypothetical protein